MPNLRDSLHGSSDQPSDEHTHLRRLCDVGSAQSGGAGVCGACGRPIPLPTATALLPLRAIPAQPRDALRPNPEGVGRYHRTQGPRSCRGWTADATRTGPHPPKEAPPAGERPPVCPRGGGRLGNRARIRARIRVESRGDATDPAYARPVRALKRPYPAARIEQRSCGRSTASSAEPPGTDWRESPPSAPNRHRPQKSRFPAPSRGGGGSADTQRERRRYGVLAAHVSRCRESYSLYDEPDRPETDREEDLVSDGTHPSIREWRGRALAEGEPNVEPAGEVVR